MLFSDFNDWTGAQVQAVLAAFNEWLPRSHQMRPVSIQKVRMIGWSLFPLAGATCVYLHFKGAGRGVFLYQACRYLFGPIRAVGSKLQWVMVLGICVVLSWTFKAPHWLTLAAGGIFILLLIYHFVVNGIGVFANEPAKGVENSSGPIFLGHEKGRPNRKAKLTEEQLNHHVHIVGASGFGKSVLISHIIKNRIGCGSGLLFVDLKADFETIRQVVSTAKAAGRIKDLYIFSCGNPEISSPYNVIARGTANQLKDRIMGALSWSEEFYKNEASSFLLKLLRGLTAVRDLCGEQFDLKTILDCASSPRRILEIAGKLPESEESSRQEIQALATHLSKAESTRALQGLRSQLESLLLSDFGHLLKANSSGIDLFEAIRLRKIVYILLDSRTYGESSRALGKLILQDLKAASARIDNEVERSKRTPFTVVVDEFSDMASEDFIGFLDRARSSKIGVVVAHQEIADLSRISPEFANRLMNSTSTLFAFLQKLPSSSELISGICGTKKTKEVTEQAKSNWLFGDEKTGMKSIKEVDEYMIHPNVIRALSVGECVLVQKYPSSKSMLLKVKPETVNYLAEAEVIGALEEMKSRHRMGADLNKPARPQIKPPPTAVDRRLSTEESNYWNNDSEMS